MAWPDLHAFSEGFTHGDADDTHEKLCEHFDGRMDEILEDVVAHFPNRAKIIRSAFTAHHEGKYELSVPVLLAQTDGICRELVGVQLCGRRKKDGRLRTATVIESWKKDNLSKAMLHQLSALLPIAFNEDERDGRSGILNRHAVLHGEDVTYDQRRQGCRAISLLGYVASVLREREPDGEPDAA